MVLPGPTDLPKGNPTVFIEIFVCPRAEIGMGPHCEESASRYWAFIFHMSRGTEYWGYNMGIKFDSVGISFSACARKHRHTESMRGIKRCVGFGLVRGVWGEWGGYHATKILRNHQPPPGTINFSCEK